LVLLHGFTQTSRLWGTFGDRLAEGHQLIALDLPGHAESDAVRADLNETAALVVDAVRETIGIESCDLLGYSLGARVALHVVTGTDLALRRVVVVGAHGGIEDLEARASRRQQDEETAAALEESGDVDGFIDRWVSGPMFSHLAQAADVQERRRNTAGGLASSLRLAGTATQEPLWERMRQVEVPLLALAGMDDSRFCKHALRLAALCPQAVASFVPGGGHAAHLAQPEVTARLVLHWLTID
jgi:2-succinyl-6-hydroxy-2,4-cyclohexadiene-1-carboxylate synthase